MCRRGVRNLWVAPVGDEAKHLGGLAQPLHRTHDFAGSTLTVEVAADYPGLSS